MRGPLSEPGGRDTSSRKHAAGPHGDRPHADRQPGRHTAIGGHREAIPRPLAPPGTAASPETGSAARPGRASPVASRRRRRAAGIPGEQSRRFAPPPARRLASRTRSATAPARRVRAENASSPPACRKSSAGSFASGPGPGIESGQPAVAIRRHARPRQLWQPFVETVGYLHTHGRASQRRRQDARVRMPRHVRRNGLRLPRV